MIRIISADKWIPVNERLPEDHQVVLVVDRYGDYEVCKYFKDNDGYKNDWLCYEGRCSMQGEVLAWMPIPEFSGVSVFGEEI